MFVSVDEAVKQLQNEQAVAIPTETVYGLAAMITSEKALKRIFEIKKRPFFDPLIVHVENIEQAKSLVTSFPLIAEELAKSFWPGPLTLILKKNASISDLITSGLERVGIRCPRHPIALEILKKVKVPLAAPSANLFGKTSPTQAGHVEDEFKGLVPVVDGGDAELGIESTVLLVNEDELAILRSGHILASDIEQALDKKGIRFKWKKAITKAESPGHMKHHYMPAKPLFWIEGLLEKKQLLAKLNDQLRKLPNEVEGVTLVKPLQISTYTELVLPKNPVEAARILYAELRRLAQQPGDCLIFHYKNYMSLPEWEPLLERLRKACSAVILT